MSLLTSLDINASGLLAQRQRVEVSSANLANSQTTRTANGGPYRRKDAVFETQSFGNSLDSAISSDGSEGVKVSGIVEDQAPFDRRYEPGHPDADADGYVSYPNVNPMEEMSNMVSASRSYEANLSAISIVKTMISKTLEIGK
jgi:flagellar basal-body rod protein FlgC